MTDEKALVRPWLVAVWPGMGHVALSAGFYLMAKLEMHQIAELAPAEHYDVDQVTVLDGIVQTPQIPRSRLFVWRDPAGKRDIVVLLSEAQPTSGKYAFCHRLMVEAKRMGVERVFTFAAMATHMHPEHASRVFAVATDAMTLQELRDQKLEVLEEGQISGLNGVLLGAADALELRGACLLGEIPHILAPLPFPKAALAILEAFRRLAEIEIDLAELAQQASVMDGRLGEILAQAERAMGEKEPEEESIGFGEEAVDVQERRKIEGLFELARQDRSRAYELKQMLDEAGLFKQYEDRFLDLFKKSG